ncbi:MAG: hypothetical protein ABI119_05965 [Gemmatimonadaceae bacterium]
MSTNLRSMVAATPTLIPPNWSGDALGREYLMPAGSKIDNTAFGSADATGAIEIPSGTVVGRTIAERNSGSPFGPAADTDGEFYITAFDITNALVLDDVELCRPYAGLVVKENFLPTALSALSVTVQAAIRARYTCTVGVS